ncbi:hypothetical protein HY345_03350 [Candidatus Microgenomates bacterium]|nr:hypothetical protein [Candidatus Microgenomates bacterium]
MPSSRNKFTLQPYPREGDTLLSAHGLFPKQDLPLTDKEVLVAVEIAFKRTITDKKGSLRRVNSSPKELVDLCIKHLKLRSCPILSPFFYSSCEVDEIFDLDAIPHEMQRQRMKIGVFYQYLAIELMRISSNAKNSNIEAVFDGSREGDLVADLKTPKYSSGLRLYASVKKSSDTVGGQDIPGVILRLENIAKSEINVTRPYICVFGYATPPNGKVKEYKESRHIKLNNQGLPYSPNCESWEPGFLFPYITGRPATDIYKLSMSLVSKYLPFYTLKNRKECSLLLKERFKKLNLLNEERKIDKIKFMKFIATN